MMEQGSERRYVWKPETQDAVNAMERSVVFDYASALKERDVCGLFSGCPYTQGRTH